MKTLLWQRLFALVLFISGALPHAHAAVVTTNYANLGNNLWTVDLALVNDSDAAGINQFTVYFSPSTFSALSVLASPPGWDSFVAQSDAALAAPGFFDSFNPQALTYGRAQAGFTVAFTLMGQGAPGHLAFDIVGRDFSATSSGVTTSVPEPSAALLLLTAGMVFGACRKTRQGETA